MKYLPCITLWQPWATALLLTNPDLKVFETRGWPIDHRGPLLIHAAAKRDGDVRWALQDEEILDDLALHGLTPVDLPFSAIVGYIEVVDCFRMGPKRPDVREMRWGNWSDERFAWKRGPKPVLFKRPIPFVGMRKIYNVPAELVQAELA